jgi:hypothetical protein
MQPLLCVQTDCKKPATGVQPVQAANVSTCMVYVVTSCLQTVHVGAVQHARRATSLAGTLFPLLLGVECSTR